MKSRLYNIIFIFFTVLLISVYADEQLKEGELLLKSGQYLKSREYFKKFIEHPNLAAQALLGIGKSEYFLSNYPEATLYLRRLLRDFKETPYVNEANLYIGLSYLKIGKYRDAEFYLKNVKPPLEKPANIGLGWIAYYKADLKTLESILAKLDKRDFSENPEAHLLRIKYLAMTGKAQDALREFESNPKLKKKHYDIDRAELMIKANRINDAEKILKNLLQTENTLTDKIKAKNMLFELYSAHGRTEEALNLGKELYFYNTSDDFKMKLFSLYSAQKNYDEAFKFLNSIRDRNLRLKKIVDFINAIKSENPQKASEYIVKIYPMLSADSAILIEYSNFLYQQGKLSDAKNILRKVLTGPRKSEAIIPYAKILINEGKLKEAKKMLEPIKDKRPEATALYGQVLYKEGDKVNALTYIRKSAKTLENPEILLLAGDLEYSLGDRKNSINYWIKSANYGNAEAALKAADYYYLSKNLKEASKYYKKAIDLGIKENNFLMWAYYQYGKINKNKSFLEKVANSEGELSQAAREILDKL